MSAAAASQLSVSDETIGYRLSGVAIAFIVLETVAVGLRYVARYIGGTRGGADDYLMLPALLFNVALCALSLAMVDNGGVGHHLMWLEENDPTALTTFAKIQLPDTVFYILAVTFPKLAILSLYLRIFTQRAYRITSYIVISIVSAGCLAIVITTFVQCTPIAYMWNPIGHPDGHCIDISSFWRWGSFPNIITDVVMLGLPLPCIWQLQLSKKDRLGLLATFCTGSIGLITSIIRFTTFFNASSQADTTWASVKLGSISMAEAGVYLIAACLPTYRSLFRSVRERVGGTNALGTRGTRNQTDAELSSVKPKGKPLSSASLNGFERLDYDETNLVDTKNFDDSSSYKEASSCEHMYYLMELEDILDIYKVETVKSHHVQRSGAQFEGLSSNPRTILVKNARRLQPFTSPLRPQAAGDDAASQNFASSETDLLSNLSNESSWPVRKEYLPQNTAQSSPSTFRTSNVLGTLRWESSDRAKWGLSAGYFLFKAQAGSRSLTKMAGFPVPIAVVGMGCRFPGGANSPEKLWDILSEGRDGWSEVPEERFTWKSFYHPDPETQGTLNHRGGHFLDQKDIAAFDAGFFGIPPIESEGIDPQHRIQLEVAYEALENAGLSMEAIQGSDSAVYLAVFNGDYGAMQYKDTDDVPKYLLTGTGHAIASNRISYFFDLKGPSVTLDTGCSGSLVAIHQACQSLRSGECKMALAGGVNLILNPDNMIPMSLLHILNNDGKCYSFDSRGAGYGRGEGAAMVVLKRLDEAIAAGDNIRAVIRNIGVGQDGKTAGILLPSRDAQKNLIQTVYDQVGLDPTSTTYIEAHGTGTAVGDVEEISAIRSVFESKDEQTGPLFVGSIKPNIGHLESASGIAGLVKAILMLENGKIPPNLNLQILKTTLNLTDSRVTIPSKLEPWAEGAPHRISVNSFGYGGTNAHAILETATLSRQTRLTNGHPNGTNGHSKHSNGHSIPINCFSEPHPDSIPASISSEHNNLGSGIKPKHLVQVLMLSAKSEKSLNKVLENLREWASGHLKSKNACLEDLAHTLVSRRSIMSWRCSFTAISVSSIVTSLDSKAPKPTRSSNNNHTMFVFTGQGAQWFAMGRELMNIPSKYRESLERSADMLKSFGASWNLIEELSREEADSRINESEIGQPATTGIQIALVDLLFSLGIKPEAVLGHSSGEIAAAYTAGALDQVSALKVAYYRGIVTASPSVNGAMLAVGLGEKEALQYLAQIENGAAVVACANSPSSSTISGDESAIIELKTILDKESIFARRLKVDTAYHSHLVKAVANEYVRLLDDVKFGDARPSVKFVSSVTGREMTTGFGPNYWVENLVSKVRFHDALEHFVRKQHASARSKLVPLKQIFVEIGPHNALSGPIRQIVTQLSFSSQFTCLSTLLRSQDALMTVLDLAGKLFEQGCSADLKSANLMGRSNKALKVIGNLMPYPWDHSTSYWHESRLSKAHRLRRHPYHDILGVRIVSSTSILPVWRHIISVDRLPWLRDHVVDGSTVFPASGYLAMAIEAAQQVMLERQESPVISQYVLKSLSFSNPLIIPESPEKVEIQIALAPNGNTQGKFTSKWEEFRVISVSATGASMEHCRGLISVELIAEEDEVEAAREHDYTKSAQGRRLRDIRARCSESIDCAMMYSDLKSKGNFYGPNFASVTKLWFGIDDALATVTIPSVAEYMPAKFMQPHVLHPTTLDALMHVPVPLFGRQSGARSVMVTGMEELVVSAKIANKAGTPLFVATTIAKEGPLASVAEISVFQMDQDEGNELVLQIKEEGLRATGSIEDKAHHENTGRNTSYQLKWELDAEHMKSSLPLFKPAKEQLADGALSQEQKVYFLNQAAALLINACVTEISADGPPRLSGHWVHFFQWMQRFLKSDEGQGYISSVHESAVESTLREAKKLGVEGEMLFRVGEKLPSIIRGEIDALALMIEDNLLYRLYTDDASTRCYGHTINYLKTLVFKYPNMKVLEVGAGTGGATVPLLKSLGHNGVLPFKSYEFTDVSSGFFERSRSRLIEWDSYMQYKKFDIERDPIEQGFEEESYDLIIASNVLHVATSIDAVLTRVRKFLKPGGRLVMIETTRVDDGRIDAPNPTVEHWNSALLRTGFNGIEIAANDYEGPAQRSAVLISKAVARKKDEERNLVLPTELLSGSKWETHPSSFLGKLKSLLSIKNNSILGDVISANGVVPGTLYIFVDDGSNPVLTTESPAVFESVKSLLVKATDVLWISVQATLSHSTNPEKGLITGLARVARAENESLKLATLDVQEGITDNIDFIVEKVKDIVTSVFYESFDAHSQELEYIFKDGQLYIPRLVPNTKLNQRIHEANGIVHLKMQSFHQPNRPLKLYVEKPGFLESFQFVDDDSFDEPVRVHEVEVEVEACGLNFKDVLIALGQAKKPMPMAGEYAGVITKVGSEARKLFNIGDRVCGYGGTAYASRVRVNAYTVSRLPTSMSFVIGASIPVIFSTAYYALIDIARLQKNQTVLIHSAAGGVGQAALRIAQHVGAEIFATVRSSAKKSLLIEEYGIPQDHIFSSKLRTFKQGIERLTNGKGVDVVLNSLSGEALQDSWASIAKFGVFLEIGKTDLHSKTLMSMGPFDGNVTFASIDLHMLFQHRPKTAGQLLAKVFSMFEAGHYKNITPITSMPLTEIEAAFRLVQARKHVGKIVLEAKSDTMVSVLAKSSETLRLSGNATYMIAGGLGGLGLEIARFMVDHGAKHVALLSRRVLDSIKGKQLEEKFQALGARVRVFVCDVTDLQSLQETISSCAIDMPPIQGLIQASMDRVLAQMDLNDLKVAMAPKVRGTQQLMKALENQPLDFFLMLSSVAGIVGNLSQGNYAAANSFMDTLANNLVNPETKAPHFVTLNLGPINDVGYLATNDRIKQVLMRQGYVLFSLKELLSVVGYSISDEAKTDQCKQIVLGFDHKSFTESDNKYSLKNPMFSHILPSKTNQITKEDSSAAQSIDGAIAAAENVEQVEAIISEAVARKISTLVAIDYDEIDLERRVGEFGLDSLVVIELKNWISQKFQAKLQSSEISDSAQILLLAALIASRSALVAGSLSKKNINRDIKDSTANFTKQDTENGGREIVVLPKQPLPELDATLDYYLDAVCPIFTNKEYAQALRDVEDFRRPGGFGRELQERLSRLAHDPNVENWQFEIYMSGSYLKHRVPLIPFINFFGTHLLTPVPRSSAETAAIISTSAFQFKLKLEAGEIEYEFINEKAIDKELYDWFFNANREPRLGKDEMMKYPGNDYVVVFRHGHVYKVPLHMENERVSFDKLKATFQSILDAKREEVSWASVLTADNRDSWAEIRQSLINVSSNNDTLVKMIEASLFVLYLDDAKPQNAVERGIQFLHNKGFNRWADKTLQYSVCDNGVSASIGEHAKTDGYIFRRLNTFITAAIMEFQPNKSDESLAIIDSPKRYTFSTTPLIDQEIARVRAQVLKDTSNYELNAFELTHVHEDFFRSFKCPPKSGIQLILQLALRKHFGCFEVARETVSLNHFHKGRVEFSEIIWPAVAKFCTAAVESPSSTTALRPLFFEAVMAHASNLMRATNGYGIYRHLQSLQWIAADDEELPALLTNPMYEKFTTRKVITDCAVSGAQEVGTVQLDLDGFWIHFETGKDRVHVIVWGQTGKTADFKRLIEQCADEVRAIIES
ncbi:hypothetical protein B7494_g345 [Chlorociboria aeruginascens]|nr:hypothetical protein B7494_g345 [Chlorociboria aeruginascens]